MKKILSQLKRRKRTGKDTVNENWLDVVANENGYTTKLLVSELVELSAIKPLDSKLGSEKLFQIILK